MTRRTVITLLIVFSSVAFVARAGTIIYFKAWERPSAMEHKSIAQQLIRGNGFTFGDWGYFGPTSVQSPPFPFLLAGMFKIFGDDSPGAYAAIMMMNAAAGAGLVWLTYLLTRTFGGNLLTGLFAAALVAVWPSQIYAARPVQAIELITCSLVGSIILFYRAVRTSRLAPWVGYSLVGTIAALTEPVFLPALAISGVLVLLWRGLAWNVRLRFAAVLLGMTFVVLGPWCVRNRIVHDKWIPVKNTFWVNMWKGNNDFATGTDRVAMTPVEQARAKAKGDSFEDDVPDTAHQYDMLDLSQRSRLKHQPEAAREAAFREFVTDWIRQNPHGYLRLCRIRLMKTLTVDWDNPKSYNTVYIVSRYVLLGLTIVGLAFAWRQRWSLLIPGVMAGTALLTYTLTVTAARFTMPFEPVQLALGAAFLAACVERVMKHVSIESTTAPSLAAEPQLTRREPAPGYAQDVAYDSRAVG